MHARIILLGLALLVQSAQACLDSQALQQLNQQELAYLNARIPPAFADALEDGQIEGSMRVQNTQACTIVWQLQLPASDIAAAQQLLAAQPARQIMLRAQGYALPEQSPLTASFALDPSTGQISKSDTLQTAELGKLRASVELMYAMLTQQRANDVVEGRATWTSAQRSHANADCRQRHAGASEAACVCVSDKLAAAIPYRQWRYYSYILSNPYAFASGDGAAIRQLDKQSQQACQLHVGANN